MEYEDIVTALGENKELVEKFNSIVEANQSNIGRIGGLESKIAEAISKKDKVMGLVRENLGINEISEDSLKSFAGNADAAVKADMEQLRETINNLATEKETIASDYESRIIDMKLRDKLRSLGVDGRVRGERAMDTLVKDLRSLASETEDGQIVFKKDGKTMFNRMGEEMGVSDIISDFMERDTDNFIFKETKGASFKGGTTPAEATQKTRMESVVSDTINSMTTF